MSGQSTAATSTATTDSTQAATTTPQTTAASSTSAAATSTAATDATQAAAQGTTATQTETPAPNTPTVPDTYELTLPEGGVLDQADLESIAALAKTKGWTNEQAQAALTEFGESLADQSTRFREELNAHPEIGGAQLEAAQQHALRALDHFLPKDSAEGQAFRTAMNKSGYGNYAPLVVLLARIGKAMGEDGPVSTNTQTAAGKTVEELFYGKPKAA